MSEAGNDIARIDALLKEFRENLYPDIDKAKAANDEAMRLSEAFAHKPGIAEALHNYGLYYTNKGLLPEAIDAFTKSIELKESLNDKIGISASYTNMGIVYNHLQEYEKALEYLGRALALARESKARLVEMKALGNTAMVYGEQRKLSESMEYYLQTLAIAKELKETWTISLLTDNIGVLYRLMGNYDEAMRYHRESYRLKKKTGDQPNLARAMGNIASVYYEQKKFREAIRWFKVALELALAIDAKVIAKGMYHNLAETYAAAGQFEQAYRYKLFSEEFKDSYLGEESRKQLIELEAKYETKKKEREIERLKEDLKAKEDTLNSILAKNERIAAPEKFNELSKREIEVLSYATLGLTDKELSAKMHISVNTVKTHLRRIFSKLDVKNRTELVAFVHRQQL